MDGSADNIIDRANCLSVDLPVTVEANGVEVTVNSKEDYQQIVVIFKESDTDEDRLQIAFPITIILSDYTEVTINNREELINLAQECRGENEDDDDIECIDFQYPISFSVYNTDFQVIDVVTIESDRQLYRFMHRIKENEVVAKLNFPVTMVYADDSTVVVNNNLELRATIKEARNACDEDDDNDYGDDNLTKTRIENYLQECFWRVARLHIDGIDNEKEYIGTPFKFFANNVVKLRVNGEFVTGTYNLLVSNAGFVLKIELENRPNLKLEWLINFLEPGLIKLVSLNNRDNRMVLERHCPDVDGDLTYIDGMLITGIWEVALYQEGATIKTEQYAMYTMDFFVSGRVQVTDPNNGTFNGSWLTYRNDGLFMGMRFIDHDPFTVLSHRWRIKEVSPGRIEMKDYSASGTIERILVLEKKIN